ncbi:uncharacterized protein LOC110027176 [Phalaenopsis equestris]|uniref:uncharacterized protein LOC110027176 n=1 Tax=Phalaenopsis equestris TaxID=78828 RepID=UPI0009E2A135|nr:uncharacterized protein LOC110027176 [Phalaenopsis equestris]
MDRLGTSGLLQKVEIERHSPYCSQCRMFWHASFHCYKLHRHLRQGAERPPQDLCNINHGIPVDNLKPILDTEINDQNLPIATTNVKNLPIWTTDIVQQVTSVEEGAEEGVLNVEAVEVVPQNLLPPSQEADANFALEE